MRYLILFISLCLSFASCKKAIEKAQEDAVIEIMTSGQWRVTKYLKGSADVTSDFGNYRFQFYENSTVDALKNNLLEKKGTWSGDVNNLTITSNFANAVHPLTLLNAVFELSDSGQTYVEASSNLNGEFVFIRLDK